MFFKTGGIVIWNGQCYPDIVVYDISELKSGLFSQYVTGPDLGWEVTCCGQQISGCGKKSQVINIVKLDN